jgi:selenide,water dikinase
MLEPVELRRDLVLVGGGHSHALALRMLAMDPVAGLRITLVSPDSHTPYSGMLPGLVAGHYHFEETHIDLVRLCQWAQVRFIAGEVTGLDSAARRLSLAGRPPLEYDLVSLDIGSQPELDSVPGARAHAVPVKPVSGLWQRWRDLRGRLLARGGGGDYRIAVVGGGAGSVELAMAMANSLESPTISIDLWCGAPEILLGYNHRARRAVMQALARLGIELHLSARVDRVEGDVLVLANGERAVFDELFWCTGAAAAPWVAASGLSTDELGFLAVRDTLQSVDDERVFAAGDIATQLNHPRPKAGVYAVRQGPVLAHNLRAYLLDKPLKEHRPQRHFLSLVSLGGRSAVADRGILAASGDWVWRWKDRIDREFMGRFQRLPRSMPARVRECLPELPEGGQAHCGGCGAKVAGDALSEVLRSLAAEYPDHCDPGVDDACPIPGAPGAKIVQSLDNLRQIVGDPWMMGRIAANHALSDLYACGARPLSALAAVNLPFSGPAIQRRELYQILSGALAEFAAVECRLSGGHSMQGPELILGFAVNGVPMEASGRLLAKRDLRPGDSLILTKPLGTGALFAAHMQLGADGRDITSAIDLMLQSNLEAARLALVHGASAATDITGFGLAGHLLEMLAGGMGADLRAEALPVMAGAAEALKAGFCSSLQADNLQLADRKMESGEKAPAILFDPQTSGGLLIAIPAGKAGALRDALRQSGYAAAEIIGDVRQLDSVQGPALRLA